MKVIVKLEIDVEVDTWELNYGTREARQIREDVRSDARDICQSHLASCGVHAEVSIRA